MPATVYIFAHVVRQRVSYGDRVTLGRRNITYAWRRQMGNRIRSHAILQISTRMIRKNESSECEGGKIGILHSLDQQRLNHS